MPVGALVELGSGSPDVPGWAVPAQPVVDRAALTRFAAACFRSAGVPRGDASSTADGLVLADARGHPSHGGARLRQYLRLLESGSASPRARIQVTARRTALERWDADHALG